MVSIYVLFSCRDCACQCGSSITSEVLKLIEGNRILRNNLAKQLNVVRPIPSHRTKIPIMKTVSGTAAAQKTQKPSAPGAKVPCMPRIVATVENGRKTAAAKVIRGML